MKRKRTLLAAATLLFWLAALLPARAELAGAAPEDLYLWRLINEARVHPLQTLARFGIDPAEARQALGEDAWILDQGLPPLAWNGSLYAAAAAHRADMAARSYYGHWSPEGIGPEDRAAAAGYDPLEMGETLGFLALFHFLDARDGAAAVFAQWLRDELTPAPREPRKIFSPFLTEAAVSFGAARMRLGSGPAVNAYVAVALAAAPAEPNPPFVLGNVTTAGPWLPADPLGTPGELIVYYHDIPNGLHFQQPVGPAGAYQFPVTGPLVGLEVVEAATGRILIRRLVEDFGENQLLDLAVSPGP
ncbi:MAG: hypothetical protein H5U10_03550 [Desulfacinum sp.]|jgi:hypothetical protein|nr:hypothetical protein [Desulfacinum sp.]